MKTILTSSMLMVLCLMMGTATAHAVTVEIWGNVACTDGSDPNGSVTVMDNQPSNVFYQPNIPAMFGRKYTATVEAGPQGGHFSMRTNDTNCGGNRVKQDNSSTPVNLAPGQTSSQHDITLIPDPDAPPGMLAAMDLLPANGDNAGLPDNKDLNA